MTIKTTRKGRDYGEPMIYMPARVFAQLPWDRLVEGR